MADQPTLGWECPKCARCYAPWVDRCYPCAHGEQNSTSNMSVYPFDADRHVVRKLTCNQCGKPSALTLDGIGQCCYGVTR